MILNITNGLKGLLEFEMVVLQVELSQDDLKVLLRILMENLGEAGMVEQKSWRPETSVELIAAGGLLPGLISSHI